MQIGELFFSLGFKGFGGNESKNFQDSLSVSHELTIALTDSMRNFGEILSAIAVKMGALSEVEAKRITNNTTANKQLDLFTAKQTDSNTKTNKNIGIIGMLNAKMKQYWGSLSTARIQLMAATSALTYFVKKASDAAVHIDKIASLTGMSSSSIQRMGDLAAQSGANIDDLAGAISHFQKNSVDIMLGRGGDIGVYQFLGLNPHEDPLVLLDKLSKKLKTMPTALGTSMARDLGLSDDLIYFLKNAENLKPASEETLLTDKEIRRLKEFNFYFNRVFDQSKRVLQKFAALITPIATQVIYFFDRMGTTFSGIMTKLEPFTNRLKAIAPLLIAIGVALFASFFPLTAAFVILAAVIDDLWGYVNGEDSLFGSYVKWLTDINGALKDAIHYYVQLRKLFTLGKHDEYFDQMEKDMLAGAKEFIEKRKEAEKNPERKEKLDKIVGMADYQLNQINPDIKTGIEQIVKSIDSSLGFTSKTGSAATTNNNAEITINVNESKTPKETATAVKQEINNAYWQRKGGAR